MHVQDFENLRNKSSAIAIRLHRYFKPKAGGQLKCSPAALKMWRDPNQRATAATIS